MIQASRFSGKTTEEPVRSHFSPAGMQEELFPLMKHKTKTILLIINASK
jgi:hypothetical protein